MTRKYFALMLTAAVVLVTATMNAGGWAVVTVDDLPSRVEAGKPLALTFTVRQHGVTPTPGLKPMVDAVSGGARVTASAAAAQKDGQYAATITLPSAGKWVVTINSGFVDSKLTLLPLTAIAPGTQAPPLSPADQGQHLFVAKGCVTCHENNVGSPNVSTRVGPQLIPRKYQDDYVARILANPSATLPPRADGLRMPDLNLKQGEIAALVAFINGPAPVTAAR